jgi:hypothetical protein
MLEMRCIDYIKDQNSNNLDKCPACEETHIFETEKLTNIKLLNQDETKLTKIKMLKVKRKTCKAEFKKWKSWKII